MSKKKVTFADMKPRVLIVNKFYYRRGGDCVCTLNLERMLHDNGHSTAIFAMQHPENLPSPWSSYWPAEVDFGGSPRAKFAALRRTLGLGEVRRSFARLLRDFRPDVVHLNNIHSYLSPVIGEMAARAGARVVWTLHDYKLICPSYSCLCRGEVCEACFTSRRHVLSRRCMKQSAAASAVAWLEALAWSPRRLSAFTHRFIAPSAFMASKMAEGGFDPGRIVTLCNFIAPEAATSMGRRLAAGLPPEREPYYCYIGRLSPEKGVDTLLRSAATLPYELRIAGDGPLALELRQRYGHLPNVRFLGRLDGPAVADLLASARLSVIPSEWYENNPLGVIESLCVGTPVVGARIGGIPELIGPADGLTFASGSADDLSRAVAAAWTIPFDHRAIAADALRRFSATAHYTRLIDIYTRP